jgi:hypothetical protein
MVNYKTILKTLQKSYQYVDKILVLKNNGKIEYSTDNWHVKEDIKGFLASWASGNAQFVKMDGVKYSILQMEPERFVGTNRHKKGHLVGATTAERDKYLIAHINNKAKGWMHRAYPTVARAAVALNDTSKLKHLDSSGKKGKKSKKAAKKRKKALKKIKKTEKKVKKKLKKDKKKKAIKYAKKIIKIADSIGKTNIKKQYEDKIDELLGRKPEKTKEDSGKNVQSSLVKALTQQEPHRDEIEEAQAKQTTEPPKIDPIIMQEVKNFVHWINDKEGLGRFISYYLEQNNQKVISLLSSVYKDLKRIVNDYNGELKPKKNHLIA